MLLILLLISIWSSHPSISPHLYCYHSGPSHHSLWSNSLYSVSDSSTDSPFCRIFVTQSSWSCSYHGPLLCSKLPFHATPNQRQSPHNSHGFLICIATLPSLSSALPSLTSPSYTTGSCSSTTVMAICYTTRGKPILSFPFFHVLRCCFYSEFNLPPCWTFEYLYSFSPSFHSALHKHLFFGAHDL